MNFRNKVQIILLSFWIIMLAVSNVTADYAEDKLKAANQAYRSGRYAKASELFEWYFDNILDYDERFWPRRNSFCIGKWVKLSKKYPPAAKRIRQKCDELESVILSENPSGDRAIELFIQTKFSAFKSFNYFLKDYQRTANVFKQLERKNPHLAERIYTYAKDQLLKVHAYSLCNKYHKKPISEHETWVEILIVDKEYGDKELIEIGKKIYVEDMVNLIRILANNRRIPEAKLLLQKSKSVTKKIGYPELYQKIYQKVQILF